MGKRIRNTTNKESESNKILDETDIVSNEKDNLEYKHYNVSKKAKEVHDSDSETESNSKKPKKKKKKQLDTQEEGSTKKGKKSIRQTKKEKFAERQAEAAALNKDNLKAQCLNYLSQWKHDKSNWKFMKVKQVWLYKNKFSVKLIPEASWPVFIEYFESAQGNIRKMLLDDANKIIKQMDDWTESNDKNAISTEIEADETELNSTKPDDIVYNRARNLIQCLQE